MEVDLDTSTASRRSKSGKGRIERKRSSRKAAIVFPKYKKGGRVSKSTKSKKWGDYGLDGNTRNWFWMYGVPLGFDIS